MKNIITWEAFSEIRNGAKKLSKLSDDCEKNIVSVEEVLEEENKLWNTITKFIPEEHWDSDKVDLESIYSTIEQKFYENVRQEITTTELIGVLSYEYNIVIE